MKIRRLFLGMMCGALLFRLWSPVIAQGGPPPWAGQGGGPRVGAAVDAPHDEFVALERFLSMSDAELDDMQRAIARVRAMTPEQREQLRSQIAAFQQLPAGQRDEIRAGWGWHDARDRDDWRAMMRGASPEQRAAIQGELQALPVEKRLARKHAILDAWRSRQAAPAPR